MKKPRTNSGRARRKKEQNGRATPKIERGRLRSPEIDSEPSSSALDALARGLISIGEKFFRGGPMLRVP